MSYDNLIAPKASRKKAKEIEENMRIYFEEKDYEEEIRKQEREADRNYQIEKTNSTINASYEKRLNDKDKQRKKKEIAVEEAINMTIPVLFSSIVFRSLPLDNDFKRNNIKYIYESASQLFNTLVSAGAINLNEDSAFKNMCEEIAVAFSNCENDDEITLPEVIKGTLNREPLVTNTITDTISNKVTKAVSDEKDFIKLRDEMKKEDKYFKEEKSLFRYLNEANIHEVIKKDSTLSKQDVMDIALAESILDYTLLETLHTCKLVQFDFLKINSVKKFLVK